MKFARPFSTFSALFKEAATKTKASKAKAPTTAKKAAKKAPKVTPYKATKEDRGKYGKLNKTEMTRLFETEADTLNMDRVRLLRRHILYNSNRDRLPPYTAWLKSESKENPGTKLPELAKRYSAMSDSEKAEIARQYGPDASEEGNVYDKYDYKTIRYPKLSGLNVYLAEALKDQTRVLEDNKLKSTIAEWSALPKSKKQHYNDLAKKKNESNASRLLKIFGEVKNLYEQDNLAIGGRK